MIPAQHNPDPTQAELYRLGLEVFTNKLARRMTTSEYDSVWKHCKDSCPGSSGFYPIKFPHAKGGVSILTSCFSAAENSIDFIEIWEEMLTKIGRAVNDLIPFLMAEDRPQLSLMVDREESGINFDPRTGVLSCSFRFFYA